MNALSNTFQILPTLLGNSQQRTYAIMAMTPSEMRSSGGLIGSVGELTTSNGAVHVGDFRPNAEYLAYGVGDHSADMKRVFTDEGPLHMSFDIRDLAVFPIPRIQRSPCNPSGTARLGGEIHRLTA